MMTPHLMSQEWLMRFSEKVCIPTQETMAAQLEDSHPVLATLLSLLLLGESIVTNLLWIPIDFQIAVVLILGSQLEAELSNESGKTTRTMMT